MQPLVPIHLFSQAGNILMLVLAALSLAAGLHGIINLISPKPVWQRSSTVVLSLVNIVFLAGFLWICWFHYQIYLNMPLELPEKLIKGSN